MTVSLALIIALIAFFVLVVLELPIGLAVGGSGVIGIVLLQGSEVASRVAGTATYGATAKYALFVIPMYVLLGALIANAGIAREIYRVINRLVGWLPGGLGAATVGATAIFSGISGSSSADVATFGRISVTEMERNGYSRPYAAAVVAAAGTFAFLIPPSIILVVYGILAEVSIPALILAGFVPGILSAFVLASAVVIKAMLDRRRGVTVTSAAAIPERAVAASSKPVEKTSSGVKGGTGEKDSLGRETLALFYAIVIFGIVVGGLYGGFFTASEAGAFGAFAALIIAVLTWRMRTTSLRHLFKVSLRETGELTSMIFLLLLGGAIFTFFVASAGVPAAITSWALSLPVSPTVVIIIFLLLMIPIGMFLDGLTVLLLTVPLAAPVAAGLGFDGIWFGILMVKMVEIGLITPPVGINCFIVSSIAKVPTETVFKYLLPFVALDLSLTAVLFAFPEIILWLPHAMGH